MRTLENMSAASANSPTLAARPLDPSEPHQYAARDRTGRFKVGNSGRPKGCRHKTTLAMTALLEGEAETITRTCIEAAKAGDMTAIRLVLERMLPPAKERPLKLVLPEVKDAQGVAEARKLPSSALWPLARFCPVKPRL